ncbi:E3 ubiquitin ligase BIG BROTHER-related isoform X2 [Gastrolobium bilobum]|uniref:E3 ubiquitin ligase BIG BROTHER-related isoform X2 n=1 Tax=Gastrolobium bilobum TaxID=150636 RepID=UPI002AB0D09A|nr:E3 ubiquitin ligase BIG BROTHER-related isoform X2 [Gastrolobium bilobum]
MENDTTTATTNNTTATDNNTTATTKVGSGGGGEVKSNNQSPEEEISNLNGEEHMQEQVEEQEEDRDEDDEEPTGSVPTARQPSRTPFANLSQVDADLALARTLQEQERAYMMLRLNNEGSDYGSWEGGSYLHDDGDDFDDLHDGTDVDEDEDEDEDEDDNEEEYENEDAFDVNAHGSAGEHDNPIIEYDPDVFSNDEAYARALQEAEEREMAARLLALAGINDREVEDTDEHGANSQDAWEDVDPDELSYEELLALGEVVGTESRGLSTDTIACLPSVKYKTGSDQHGSSDSCVICRVDYEDGESLTVLSCKHLYHPECINNWLKINKVCPVCSTEVSASGSSL